MYYQFFEWNHAFVSPVRAFNDAVRLYYRNPLNPLTHTEFGRQVAAAGDLFERMTRRYGKPEFGIDSTEVDGKTVAVTEKVVWKRPFCSLLHFERNMPADAPRQPKVVLVAPLSGHYATLLRGTVQALLPDNDVYITDWADARMVPLNVGRFDLDDFIDYMIDIVHHFDGDVHLVAVCQPAVPVFAATALLEQRKSDVLPRSITLMGGPIDPRQNPTDVNIYAANHDLDWFRRNVIMPVPFPHPGFMRKVYPGFLQLSGFMTMNLDRHLTAHYDYFDDLVKGDGDSAEKHREFYDEYLSVMDLTAEFYLQTVDTVFLRQALPKGEMMHRNEKVDPGAIRRTPILTIEGEKDDISGVGQTKAAHALTPNLPDDKHVHYEQKEVGHYGVFNGSRFRREIAPRITAFVAAWDDAGPEVSAGATDEMAEQAAEAVAVIEAVTDDVAKAADTLSDLAAKAEHQAETIEQTDAPSPSATDEPEVDTAANGVQAMDAEPQAVDAPAAQETAAATSATDTPAQDAQTTAQDAQETAQAEAAPAGDSASDATADASAHAPAATTVQESAADEIDASTPAQQPDTAAAHTDVARPASGAGTEQTPSPAPRASRATAPSRRSAPEERPDSGPVARTGADKAAGAADSVAETPEKPAPSRRAARPAAKAKPSAAGTPKGAGARNRKSSRSRPKHSGSDTSTTDGNADT